MPDATFYGDGSLDQQILQFAEHHHDPRNRHISLAEKELLEKAAHQLAAKPAKSIVSVLAVAGAVLAVRELAPRLRDRSRRVAETSGTTTGNDDTTQPDERTPTERLDDR